MTETHTGASATSVPPRDRGEAVAVLADLRRIVTDTGIERLEKVRVGGIDQWVSIRGLHRDNPVLLMLHGGPGFVSMPTSWYFQRGWEEYFTVVQWDQRGAGKTYRETAPEIVAPTMTIDRMVHDAEELIDWLLQDLGKERLFLLGHSWGSHLGLTVATRRPELLHGYVGVGQFVDGLESERRGWEFARSAARADANRLAEQELDDLAPYAEHAAAFDLEQLETQRRWLSHYGGAVHNRSGFDAEVRAVSLAPEYTDADVTSVWTANSFSQSQLLTAVLTTSLQHVDHLDCPVALFLGRHDHNVSATLAAEWLEQLDAPLKRLVWFEDSAHEVMIEEPGKTLVSLVQLLRPLAEAAGDVPTSEQVPTSERVSRRSGGQSAGAATVRE